MSQKGTTKLSCVTIITVYFFKFLILGLPIILAPLTFHFDETLNIFKVLYIKNENLINILYFFQEKMGLSQTWKLLLVTGFCGGFSTFSTFSFETFEMLRNGQTALAFANVFVSLFLCLFVLYIIYKKSIL